ncbi:MAG: trimethylamine methyltransferase family protein [Chloroflexota bacterium]|nr:trimethylamine methyltransferase family protein [Chloroflexota bacterium]
MLSNVDILTKEDLERLQAASYHILDRVGVHVPHNAILERLAEAGATADFDRQVVRLPQGLVLWAVDRAGKEHTLFGRNPSRQARFGPGSQLAMSSSGQFALVDPIARTRRQPTHEDTVRAIRLAQALPEIDVVGVLAEPADLPIRGRDVAAHALLVRHTDKPLAGWLHNGASARWVLEILAVAAGGRQALVARPLTEAFVEPISPLSFRPEGLDILWLFAEWGLPVGIGPMVMALATGPATLAGTAALENAEILAGIVISQVLRPGLPVTYWGIPHVMDPATANICFGAPEQGILAAVMAQLGRSYGLPVGVNVGLTDSKLPDAQAGMEKSSSLLLGALAGANIFGHLGIAGADQGACLEQLVIDNEMMGALRRTLGGLGPLFAPGMGLAVNDESLALDVIERVGIGGSFLGDVHTRQHYRQEIRLNHLADRTTWDTWASAGSQDMLQRAASEVDRLLSLPPAPPQPEQEQEIAALLDAALKELNAA